MYKDLYISFIFFSCSNAGLKTKLQDLRGLYQESLFHIHSIYIGWLQFWIDSDWLSWMRWDSRLWVRDYLHRALFLDSGQRLMVLGCLQWVVYNVVLAQLQNQRKSP